MINDKDFTPSHSTQEDHSFNWKLFLTIGWLSRWWIVLYFIVALVIAYLYGRYASPVYEAQADVQFKDRSKDNAIDLGILVSSPNVDRLNEEMTILKSKGYKIDALSTLPLQTSYFVTEHIKSAEVYTESPLITNIEVLDSAIIGTKIEFAVIDSNHYTLKYTFRGINVNETFTCRESYNAPGFNINAYVNLHSKQEWAYHYYMIINDMEKEAERIEDKIVIDVDNLYGGKIIINYRDGNQLKCRDVVNKIAEKIMDLSLARKSQSAELIITFIQDQIDSLEKQLYNQETILKNFKKDNLIINPDLAETNIVEKLNEVDQLQFEVMLEKKSLQWLDDFINNKNNDLDALANYFGDLKYNDFSPYLNSLLSLNKQKENLGLSVLPGDPRLMSINKQITEVKNNFKVAISNAKDKLNAREAYLNSEEKKYEAQFLQLPEKESEYARLTRLNDLKEKYYLLLLEKQSEYEISRAGMTSDYVILDSAEPGHLVAPVKTKIWGICILVFIGFSFAHIYFKFLLHDKIIGVPDIEKDTRVPILGTLPQYVNSKIDTPRIVVRQNPKSHLAESFRAIRSNLQYMVPHKTDNWMIAVTSTVSGEGKTFTALNLANVIASTGKKVILVDYDLRKPKVHKAFNVKNDKGVSTVLIGKHRVEDCIQFNEESGCDILIAGPIPPNPAELLVSPANTELLHYLKNNYEMVLLDCPPVGIVSDSIPILAVVDLSIYLLRAGYSKRNFIGNINRLYFDNKLTNICIVVNDANASGTNYGYGYGYGYNYGYGNYEYNDYYSDTIRPRSFFRRFFNLGSKK